MIPADTHLQPGHTATHTAAREVLEIYATTAWPGVAGVDHPADAGPVVLAALLHGGRRPEESDPASRALATWLKCINAGVTHTGVFSWGLAGCFMGAQLASKTWPAMSGLAACFRSVLVERAAMHPWRLREVGWRDYDLITGPSGIALAMATDPACVPASVSSLGIHLAALCDSDDLERLRVGDYRGEELRGWNHARINTGLAHGVAGVVSALRTIAEIRAAANDIAIPLQTAAHWLVRQSFTDSRRMVTWPSAARDGRPALAEASRRQAWCYGTPGIAWTLWEAGRVLDDHELQSFALDAVDSFLEVYDDAFYLDGLGVCHGAAGMVLIADAFARYAGLRRAAELRDHLERHLLDHLHEAVASSAQDCSLLSGSSGALIALLTLHDGDRTWLPVIALR